MGKAFDRMNRLKIYIYIYIYIGFIRRQSIHWGELFSKLDYTRIGHKSELVEMTLNLRFGLSVYIGFVFLVLFFN